MDEREQWGEKERALAIQRTFASEPADYKRNMIGYNII